MKILIIEDDIHVIKILERIIEERKLGKLLGHSMDGIKGLADIKALKPDIVLVDLLMPRKDGLSLVQEVKTINPQIQFIMISQVSSKDMIGKAYRNGVEYYVNKPVNALEVESVIQKVIERLNMNRTLNQIQNLFHSKEGVQKEKVRDYEHEIKFVMQKIGIIGESGNKDIIEMIHYLIETDTNILDYTMEELCRHFTDNPKSMEQRIRRTAYTGMVNIANLGIEDYMHEIFVEYSNSLYNFEQIKREMDYIRGKSKKRGKVNLKKFIDGIVFYCKNLS
ncbi:response regulator [Marinisporobacter balticus]|uniref:Stage 0 sporulation protein A homolog n=1 Tax=Marinisporobacter balticus TaxID=2018667 RepID=A0A4R2L622_9FIRM|nr:response regulator [Marinisporobacter balticus]TCO79396.1 two-component system response regulator YcbB [Marinisporobacter balticus]